MSDKESNLRELLARLQSEVLQWRSQIHTLETQIKVNEEIIKEVKDELGN